MPPRTGSLGELELVVLLAVLRLGDEAYGAAIRDEIRRRTGRAVTPGAVYPTLDRLEAKGFVQSRMGDPQPERGGRARRHFTLTRVGSAELRRAWRQYAALARGLEADLAGGR